MFDKDLNITGEPAHIIKKYSKKSQASGDNQFTLLDQDGKKLDVILFDTMADCYMNCCVLGLISGKKIKKDEVSNPSVDSATIFASQLIVRRNQLLRIYHHITLAENNNESIETKIKTAFSIKGDATLAQEKLNEYARGGAYILDSYFSNCTSTEDLGHAILKLCNDFTADININGEAS